MIFSELNLKNRIAFSFLSLTTVLMLVIFVVVYLVVSNTVYVHLNEDLEFESSELRNNILVSEDSIIVLNKLEWNEAEHRQIEVNPTFMQIVDSKGKIIQKTPNLLESSLPFLEEENKRIISNLKFSNSSIRCLQEPILNSKNKIVGYILLGIPLEESELVLTNLLAVLIITFPIIIIILFFSTRIIAGKSIFPIADIIKTTETITRENLNERVKLPKNKDELYRLVVTINELLERLEDGLIREKQFTSDASHELRTPLATIKGTLEVLIRKPRSVEQYEEKVQYCINEVDRMTELAEQLLVLARYDSGNIIPQINEVSPAQIINRIIERLANEIVRKEVELQADLESKVIVKSDASMLEIIFSNLISNSIKYSNTCSRIELSIVQNNQNTAVIIKDNGFGMDENQINKIYNRFYRGDDSRNKSIGGSGLGLAIVKKLSDLLNLEITIESLPQKGTTFIINFPTI